MFKGQFDVQVSNILMELEEEAKSLGINRINSAMMLKALLEAEDSLLWDAISGLKDDTTFYPELIDETELYLPESEWEEDEELSEGEQKIYPSIKIYTERDGEKSIYFDEDLKEFLVLIEIYFEERKEISLRDFTSCFLNTMSNDAIKVLRTYGISTTLLKAIFPVLVQTEKKKYNFGKFEIPAKFKSFVKNLNESYKDSTCDILGRDKECKFIWQTMQKQTKKNVILIGEPGVGKTAIVKKITHDIISGNCPKGFENFTVLSLDVTSSVAGTKYRGEAEERYSAFVEFLENQKNIIVFIDEIHLIRGAGACKEGEIDLANALKPILAGGNVRIIGATTRVEYEKYFSQDGAIKRRFRPIKVEEPKMKEVAPMLKKSIETLSKYHGVSISENMVDFVILNAACFDNETCNPDRTKDLIDLSMVVAKQAGKDKVDRESVLANFEYHFERFDKMTDYAKRSTAYHEAGHCLLASYAESLKDREVIAVSIMPTDTYLGVTVYEDNENTVEPTMEYFIDSIAVSLAGRVAEKMFTTTITSGASSDLAKATKTAHDIVARYGMVEYGMNRTYTEENRSEEVKNLINQEIDKLIEKAMKRAEDILTQHQDTLELLVNALMQKGIVGTAELKEILNIEQTTPERVFN